MVDGKGKRAVFPSSRNLDGPAKRVTPPNAGMGTCGLDLEEGGREPSKVDSFVPFANAPVPFPAGLPYR